MDPDSGQGPTSQTLCVVMRDTAVFSPVTIVSGAGGL